MIEVLSTIVRQAICDKQKICFHGSQIKSTTVNCNSYDSKFGNYSTKVATRDVNLILILTKLNFILSLDINGTILNLTYESNQPKSSPRYPAQPAPIIDQSLSLQTPSTDLLPLPQPSPIEEMLSWSTDLPLLPQPSPTEEMLTWSNDLSLLPQPSPTEEMLSWSNDLPILPQPSPTEEMLTWSNDLSILPQPSLTDQLLSFTTDLLLPQSSPADQLNIGHLLSLQELPQQSPIATTIISNIHSQITVASSVIIVVVIISVTLIVMMALAAVLLPLVLIHYYSKW